MLHSLRGICRRCHLIDCWLQTELWSLLCWLQPLSVNSSCISSKRLHESVPRQDPCTILPILTSAVEKSLVGREQVGVKVWAGSPPSQLLPIAKVLHFLGACCGAAAAPLFCSNSYRTSCKDLESMILISICSWALSDSFDIDFI